jgi:chitodextrinase
LIFALLSLASPAAAQTGSLTLAWDANTEADLAGYVVLAGTQAGGPYVDRVTTTATEARVDGLQAGTTYYFVVRAVNALGIASGLSNEVRATTTGQPDDPCAPVTGRYAVSVFPSSLLKTGSGGPGSRARVLFQLGSPNAPVTTVTVSADGAPLAPTMRGENLTDVPGMWFTLPPGGTYRLEITAANNQGCSRTAVYPVPLTVP